MTPMSALPAHPPPLKSDQDGVVRVGTTRVTLETVVGAFQNGCSPEEIVLKYSSLDLTDVYAVITYYLWHREEVGAYLQQRRKDAARLREKIEADYPPEGVRQRLLSSISSGSRTSS